MCRRNFHAMRELVSLLVLGLLMALFHRVTGAGPLEARATLALGFLVLVAYAGGALAARLRLPRLTGYLLTGLAVGPSWARLVRADEIQALSFIGDAALALIAFAAGSRLKIESLRAARRPLARITAGAVAFPFAFTAGATLALSPWFPLTAGRGLGDAVAVALALGVWAAAASPVLTIAVMNEADARGGEGGPFSHGVLGVTVVMDVLALAFFALVLVAARPLVSEGALQLPVAWTALVRVAASLAVGAVTGLLLARYLRVVQRDTPLIIVALGFATAYSASLLGLEVVLVALAAGFHIANISPMERERLVEVLERGSLPVYMVFFALAGAGLQLGMLRDLMGWVVVLVAIRALGLRYGVRWAGRSPGVTPVLAQHGWLGLISQGGLVLGLAALARRAFPAWGVSLEGLMVAMIGVHELIGPVLFRRALRLAGEVKEAIHVPEIPAMDRSPVPLTGGGV